MMPHVESCVMKSASGRASWHSITTILASILLQSNCTFRVVYLWATSSWVSCWAGPCEGSSSVGTLGESEGGHMLELASPWVSTRSVMLAVMCFCGMSPTLPSIVAGLSMLCCWLRRTVAVHSVPSDQVHLIGSTGLDSGLVLVERSVKERVGVLRDSVCGLL